MAVLHRLDFGFIGASASFSSSGELLNFTPHFEFFLTESSPNSFNTQLLIPSEANGTSEDAIVFFITSSGRNPLIGIGTDNPQSTFDIKDQVDNSKGVELLIRNARTTTKGADPGDAAGTINFIIDSGSYNNIQTSGSVAKITTEVLNVTDEGAIGDLLFQTAQTEKEEPITIMRMGHNGSSLTSSLDISTSLTADKIALGTVAVGNVNSGGIGMSGDLSVLGNTSLGNQSSDTHEFNGSITASNDISASGNISASRLTLESSGSTILDVIGSQGQLFSITDSLSGSLFAVSDITGLPILEVFSDDTVKIGTFNDEAIIVSGSNATITGSFTGSFVGDGSGLTGVGTVDTTGTPANNQIAIFTDSDTIEGDANFTWSGTVLEVAGRANIDEINIDDVNSGGGFGATGDYGFGSQIYVGSSITTLTSGKVYYLTSTGAWTLASSGSEASVSGFLGVRTSTGTTSTSGMLLNGIIRTGTTGTVGQKVYIADGGTFTTTLPTTSGDFVRLAGYLVGNSTIYFNPSPDYIELT